MKLNYTIKEVKAEERKLTIAERCMICAANNVDNIFLNQMSEEAKLELKRIGLVGACKPYSTHTVRFETITTRVATPSEIVAWNVLNIETLCDSGNLLCDICPLDMIIPVGECCNITTRARNAKQIMDGKEMIVEVVL